MDSLVISPEVRLEMIRRSPKVSLARLSASETILKRMPLEECDSRLEEGAGMFILEETNIFVVCRNIKS